MERYKRMRTVCPSRSKLSHNPSQNGDRHITVEFTKHAFWRLNNAFIYAFILEERIIKSGSVAFCELPGDDSLVCVFFL